MQEIALVVVGYFVCGIVISIIVAVRGKKRSESGFSPLWFLAGYEGWLAFFLWPLWLWIQLVDQQQEKAKQRTDHEPRSRVQAGMSARVVTELRPSGQVRIVDEILSARAVGEVIPEGAEVVVTALELGGVVVERKKGEPGGRPNAA